ncbi:MAG: hypothetical protein IJE26_04535, partial [Oscillospiraceae bacterium]|nr:hypothetical protein [Oscillospiraceae bacterium]
CPDEMPWVMKRHSANTEISTIHEFTCASVSTQSCSGIFTVIGGGAVYNGEGWSDNGNGTVTTGPTEAGGTAPFFDEFGSSVWAVDGQHCSPIY